MVNDEKIKQYIDDIENNGFVYLNKYEDIEEYYFQILYKLQQTGKYRLDKTPEQPHERSQWIILKDNNYELSESIIKTNNSVQENYKSQNKVSNWNIGLAAISVTFIMISTILQLTSKSDKNLEAIRIEIAKQDTSLRKLVSSLDSLTLSMKKSILSDHIKAVFPKPDTSKK